MADAERVRLVQDAFWRNEKLRRRLQLAEDMARRDPVWAEKMARRHAEFNAKRSALAAVTTTAPTPEVTTTGASVPDWRDQRAKRRAELEEKAARRQAEFTALIPAIAAQAAAEVSAAIAAAFRDARAEHHEDLAAKVPTTCSSECSSKNAPAFVSVTISNSSTTICGVVPELAAPTVSDKAVDMDIPGETAPTATIYLPGGPDPTTDGEDTVSVSMTPWSAPPSFNAPLDELPSPWSAPMGVLELFMLSPSTCSTDCSCHRLELPPKLLTKTYDQFNVVSTGNGIAPWPPPSCTSAGAALIHGHDLFQHAQQNRGNKFSVKGRKGDWYAIFLEVELKPPWPSLGVCTNLPMGHLLSSLGCITVNDNSSHYANWCLYDVFWKLSRWWSHTECVRPANAILDVSSWLWITSKHGKVQFQCSSPLLPVNCHTMAYFPLSRRAQMNVESNCGISLKLFVYCRYPVLNSAHTCPWIAGLLPPCGRESDVVLMLIYQLPVPYLQLFPGLLGAVQGYIISSSSAFLAMINGGLEVQQHYTCMMVLSVAVCKGWIPYHILQNNTHYPEMMQWSFSQSQLQSAFQFSTPGNIPFMLRTTLFHLHVESVELIRSSVVIWLCCFSSQGAELLVFCVAACSISNLHCIMDIMEISGDWHFLVKMETEWNATLTVIIFDRGVQCVQLQPIVFKILDHSCCDTHYLLASATANKMFDFLLVRRAACALWISCCLDNLHCSLGNITLAIPDWVMSNPWPPLELEFLLSIEVSQAIILTTSMVLQPTKIGEFQPWAHAFGIECEHLHWPCFPQATCHSTFSDVAVYSLVHAENEGWFQFYFAGKASLYSYGTAQIQWEIAWPPTALAYSIHYGMHLYRTLECSIVICYLEIEIICAAIHSVYVPHLHWDPGGFSRHWLGVIKTKFSTFACLLVGSYLASSESGRSETVTFGESMPPLNQLMLNVYHIFSPGTPIKFGLLMDVLVQDWLICLNGRIIQCGFEVTQWKIAWSFLLEYLDVGNQSRHFIPAAAVTYPGWYFSWDPSIWALVCFCGLFTQVVAKGGIMVEAPTYCYYHYNAVFLGQASSTTTTSSTLCKYTLIHAYYFDKVCAGVFRDQVHIGGDYCHKVFLEHVFEPQVPWDPGGSTWHWLEVKPKFKEGGMLAMLFPISFMGWTVGWTYWPGLGGSHRSLQLHIRGDQQRMTRLGTEWLRPPLPLSPTSSSTFRFLFSL